MSSIMFDILIKICIVDCSYCVSLSVLSCGYVAALIVVNGAGRPKNEKNHHAGFLLRILIVGKLLYTEVTVQKIQRKSY